MNTLLNWEEYAFTLDQKRCEHVEEAFVTLFNKGLILKIKDLCIGIVVYKQHVQI